MRDVVDGVALGTELVSVGLHGGTMEDELLLMKGDGVMMVVSEDKGILSEIDGPAFLDRWMVLKKLMGENEGGTFHFTIGFA